MGFLERSFIDLAMGQEQKAMAGELLARKMRQRYYDQITDSQIVRIKLPTTDEMKAELLVRLLDPDEGLNELLANQLRTRLQLPEITIPNKPMQSSWVCHWKRSCLLSQRGRSLRGRKCLEKALKRFRSKKGVCRKWRTPFFKVFSGLSWELQSSNSPGRKNRLNSA